MVVAIIATIRVTSTCQMAHHHRDVAFLINPAHNEAQFHLHQLPIQPFC
jgi:hypothetical protein